mgnify:CR=1 FL=1
MQLAEAEFYGKTSTATDQPLPEIAMPEGMEDAAESPLMKQDTKEIKTDKVAEALEQQVMKLENEGEDPVAGERPAITKLSDAQKAIFSYFVPVDGMERQICQVLTGASARLSKCASSATGNILIQGGKGCGKTVLATGLIKALQKEVKRPNGKIGKIDAEALNKKDLSALLKKISGGCLIIERAGEIDRETAVKLSLLLETDTSGILVIMEDTRVGLNQAMGRDEGLAKKFTEKITIPVFTSDELVEFGKAYAHDLDYEMYPDQHCAKTAEIMREKGIETAINVIKKVNDQLGYLAYSLDIYGQVDTTQTEWFENLKKHFPEGVRYCGCVDADKSRHMESGGGECKWK